MQVLTANCSPAARAPIAALRQRCRSDPQRLPSALLPRRTILPDPLSRPGALSHCLAAKKSARRRTPNCKKRCAAPPRFASRPRAHEGEGGTRSGAQRRGPGRSCTTVRGDTRSHGLSRCSIHAVAHGCDCPKLHAHRRACARTSAHAGIDERRPGTLHASRRRNPCLREELVTHVDSLYTANRFTGIAGRKPLNMLHRRHGRDSCANVESISFRLAGDT